MKNKLLFYTGGGLSPDYPNYIVRRADQDAMHSLNDGKFIFINAPRQMGKTSLLNRVAAKLELQGWLCPAVDLSTFRNLDEPRWFQHLGEQIAQTCKVESLQSPLENQQHFRSLLLDEIGLKRSAHPIKLALILDEVEGLLGLNFGEVFLSTLRDLYQRRHTYPGKFLAAFAGSIDPDILIKGPTSPFNVAQKIFLDDFTLEESHRLTTNLSELDPKLPGNIQDQIYRWASGQPHLTQRICEIIENMVRNKEISSITPDVVDYVVHSSLLSRHSLDSNISHVTNEITGLESYPAALWTRLIRGDIVTSTSPGYYALSLTGAVTEGQDGHIRIRNEIYSYALKTTAPVESNPQSKFIAAIKTVLALPQPIGRFVFDIFGRDSAPSSSIIMGWFFIMVITLLILGFIQIDVIVNIFKDIWRFFFPAK